MFGSIISDIVDGILSAAIRWLQAMQQRREDVQEGREEIHTADVEATVKEATDAAKIKEQVDAGSVSDAADDLDRLRVNAAARPK